MKVFISWSGPQSRQVAFALREWLPRLMETVKPWMSSEDIPAGARWSEYMNRELEETQYGILCVSTENQTAPWLLFEAGALAKAVPKAYVCPYLINLEPSGLPEPLRQFQAKKATEEGTWELIRSINSVRQEQVQSEQALTEVFEMWWPRLEKKLLRRPAALSVDTARTLAELLTVPRSLRDLRETLCMNKSLYLHGVIDPQMRLDDEEEVLATKLWNEELQSNIGYAALVQYTEEGRIADVYVIPTV